MICARLIGIACLFPFLAFSNLFAAESGMRQSTLADRQSVAITVYNDNIGLIKEVRGIQLPEGAGELRFIDVAARILPASVHARSLNGKSNFTIYEQNYEYDLMDENKLLDKYVGKMIKIIDFNPYQDRQNQVDARLLSNHNGQVYEIDNQIYLGHPGYKVLPKLPQNLIATPTLTWIYDNQQSQPHQIEVSYLSEGMNWRADYVMTVNADDTQAGMTGWVTITNESGGIYDNAQLSLVAGKINRVRQSQPELMAADAMVMNRKSAAPSFSQEQFFEYHLYRLQRPTTIKNNQSKQISLLEAEPVQLGKQFLAFGQAHVYMQRMPDPAMDVPVEIYLRFDNRASNHLGRPLPAGIVRLYKRDSSQSLQFIGEDRIDHTPADESVTLKIGQAFDVVVKRMQTDFRQISTRQYESEWKLTLRNHKDQAVTVGVVERLPGNWQVLKSSIAYQKRDAFSIQFDVPLAAKGQTDLTYRVRTGL